jgi:hypothetical protein
VLQTFLVSALEHLARARFDLETAGKEGRPTIDGEKRIEPPDEPNQVLEVGPVVLQGEDHSLAADFVEEEGCLGIEDVEGQIGEKHFGRPVEERKMAPVCHNPAVVAQLLVPRHLLSIQRKLPFVDDGRESQPEVLLPRKRREPAESFRRCLEQDSLTPSLESRTQETMVVEAEVQRDGPI